MSKRGKSFERVESNGHVSRDELVANLEARMAELPSDTVIDWAARKAVEIVIEALRG